ncbi:Inositol-1,4,5-trisphosphate 5-phosphatase 1 [Coemansia sp. RSA 1836]|nr:Inositol-1,4,5-trisphosphate 5-phosphatase 1 [Coemansia sp. RSA 1836]
MIYDQLSMQMASGKVFRGYQEAEIHFPPTYKFDDGTNTYDTSEKMRVPSWTDRIMYSGNSVRALEYYRDEITFSDHKPVLAMMEFDVVSVDKAQKRQILRKLYARRHGSMADAASSSGAQSVKSVEQRLIDWDNNNAQSVTPQPVVAATSLPSPSSSTHAWWDDEIQPASKAAFRFGSASPAIRRDKPGSAGRIFINPFASTLSAMASSAVSPVAQVPPKQLVNIIDDPFADDATELTWEPIVPM